MALARCATLPEPDPDEQPLLDALAAAGIEAQSCSWEDPSLDWGAYELTILRATWNYYRDPDRFRGWLTRVAKLSRLHNPLPLVLWNMHKRYLGQLTAAGVAAVDTEWIEAGQPCELSRLLDRRGWNRVVVKPAISAASFCTHVMSGSPADQRLLSELLAERAMMVQPYIEAVETDGERCLVWIDGSLTHAVRKRPRFSGAEEAVSDAALDPDDDTLVADALRVASSGAAKAEGAADVRPPLYARVDVVRDRDGRKLVMELELIEPSLYFDHEPRALRRFVAGVQRELLAAQ